MRIIEYKFTSSGYYYFSVSPYQLIKNSGSASFPGVNVYIAVDARKNLSLNTPINSNLTANSSDLYRFNPSDSGDYIFTITGPINTVAEVYYDGSLIGSGQGTSFSLTVPLSASCDYDIKIRGSSASVSGSYTVSVKQGAKIFYAGGSHSGYISNGSTDEYKLMTFKPGPHSIYVTSTVYTNCSIYSGNVLVNSYQGYSYQFYTWLDVGTYEMRITGLDSSTSGTYTVNFYYS